MGKEKNQVNEAIFIKHILHLIVKKRFMFIGDSVSDRGEMNEKDLLGVIPMKYLSGVYKSGTGRFTNGWVWIDYFAQMLIDEHGLTLDSDKYNDPDHIGVEGSTTFFRTYCEGGLTAADYRGIDTPNLIEEVKGEILSSLAEMRERIIKDDKLLDISKEDKAETLVVEWSGPNDLITVTNDPARSDVRKAAAARIENVKELMKEGYQDFILMGLLDLSKTPRFATGDKKKAKKLQRYSNYFNEFLIDGINKLNADNPDCSVHFFGLNELFNDLFENPDKYGIKEEYLTETYIDKHGCPRKDDADLFPFWDEVHPTTKVQEELAKVFYDFYAQIYQYMTPEDSLLEQFRERYGEMQGDKRNKCMPCIKRSPSIDYLNEPLPVLFKHGRKHQKGTTYKVLTELNMINDEPVKKKKKKTCCGK